MSFAWVGRKKKCNFCPKTMCSINGTSRNSILELLVQRASISLHKCTTENVTRVISVI